jgi:hypothetical protein
LPDLVVRIALINLLKGEIVMDSDTIKHLIETESFFDSLSEIKFDDLKNIFNYCIKKHPALLNDLVNNLYENYKDKYPDLIHEDEDIWPYNLADWAEDVASKMDDNDLAKPFYKMAGMFYETYYDMVNLLNLIVKTYKDIDKNFIVEAAEFEGWGEFEDESIDDPEDFEMELDIDIANLEMESEILEKMKMQMRNF